MNCMVLIQSLIHIKFLQYFHIQKKNFPFQLKVRGEESCGISELKK